MPASAPSSASVGELPRRLTARAMDGLPVPSKAPRRTHPRHECRRRRSALRCPAHRPRYAVTARSCSRFDCAGRPVADGPCSRRHGRTGAQHRRQPSQAGQHLLGARNDSILPQRGSVGANCFSDDVEHPGFRDMLELRRRGRRPPRAHVQVQRLGKRIGGVHLAFDAAHAGQRDATRKLNRRKTVVWSCPSSKVAMPAGCARSVRVRSTIRLQNWIGS